MGFYIRKSISAGPFRFNLSGSGVGMSVGVKGFRVGTGPRGNYVHMGRGGVYYHASLGGAAPKRASAGRPMSLPAAADGLTPIELGNVLEMEPSNGSHLVDQINEKMGLMPLWPWCFGLGCIFSLMIFGRSGLEALGAVFAIATLAATVVAMRWDQTRKAVVIMYDLADEAAQRFQSFTEEFDRVAGAARIWNVQTAGATADWKRNAGASRLISRTTAFLAYSLPRVIKTNVSSPSITGGRQSIHFLPDIVLVVERSRAGALSYDQLRVLWSTSVFIEEDGVPGDSEVVGHTWRFVNKNGTPDRRFNNNRQIPRVLYQYMGIQGDGGLQKLLQLSKVGDRSGFDAALAGMRMLPRDLQHAAALPAPASAAVPQPARISDDDAPPRAAFPGKDKDSVATIVAIVLMFFLAAVVTFAIPSRTTTASAPPAPVRFVRAPEPYAVSPSFDCGRVHSRVLKLVCATPVLARADLHLAAAYVDALQRSANPPRLRKTQRAWIRRRNNSQADVELLQRMYAKRISDLRSLSGGLRRKQ